MLIDIDDWEEDFHSVILDRGLDYYSNGRVLSLSRTYDHVQAVVAGTEDYNVEVSFDGDMIVDLDCDCPYAAEGKLCKHMAAVLYALEDEEDGADYAAELKPEADWAELLEGLSPEELRALILKLVQNDRALQDKLRLYLAPADDRQLVSLTERQLSEIVEQYSRHAGYISYADGMDFSDAVLNFLEEQLSVLTVKNPSAGLAVLNSVIAMLADVEMDGSNGEHGIIINDCQFWWQTLYAAADAPLRAKMWQTFTANWSTWHSFDEDAAWAIAAFCVEQGASDTVLAWLDSRIHAETVRPTADSNRSYQLQQDILQRAALMAKLSYTPEEIAAYLRQFVAYDDVRLALIELDMAHALFGDALTLIEEGLAAKPPYGLLDQYHRLRLTVWQQMGDAKQYQEGLFDYLTHFSVHDLEDYHRLKALCPPQEWPALAEAVLAFQGQSRSQNAAYLDMLLEEGKESTVLDHFARTHDLSGLKHYARRLCAHYPQEVLDIFRSILSAQAEKASCRNDYKRLTNELRALRQYPNGANLSDELVSLWRTQYKRRSAMLAELSRL